MTCHIIREPDFWRAVDGLNTDALVYCYNYSMYVLRQEETIMFSQVKPGSRVLFTLEQAAALPSFSNVHIDKSPYVLQMTNTTDLRNTMPFYLPGRRHINDAAEFNRRFEIATGGIFRGINLKQYGGAITGSILIPCVHRSPLEDNFDTFDEYLEYYYPSYDSLTPSDYKAATEFIPETAGIYEDDDPLVAQTENKTERKGVDYNQIADIDISITTTSKDTFKKHVFEIYSLIKKNSKGHVYINEILTQASVKYKIFGPGIRRHIDIFRIPYDPAKMVKKFHVHAVKMYYDSANVILFRSCVASLLSGINESYKWFSCNKIAADVLLKYAQRGLTIILNPVECDIIANYVAGSDRWKAVGATKFCAVSNKHPFFRLKNVGCRYGMRDIEQHGASQSVALTIPEPTYLTDKGVLMFKDTKKIYVPDIKTIDALC
jgi:hypothetical protein